MTGVRRDDALRHRALDPGPLLLLLVRVREQSDRPREHEQPTGQLGRQSELGSFVAGTISTVLLTFVAKPIGSLAGHFQATDYFAITLLGMVAVTALVGHSLVRGLLSLTVGLFIGLIMALLVGVAGFFMRKLDFPIAPVILGVILGPTMEEQFRRALVISNGDASVFVTRPLSLVVIVLTVLALFVPYLPRIVARVRGTRPSRDRLTFGEDD